MIDDAVGRIVAALDARGFLDNTWIIYTSDHGEMGGNHGMMSKCVLYDPAVRVPLIVRPPGGCAPRVVDGLVEHLDVPATVRDIAAAPALPRARGARCSATSTVKRPKRRAAHRVDQRELGLRRRSMTERYKLVVDEDAIAPCQLFDGAVDPHEDDNRVADSEYKPVVDELMDTHVRPFLATAPVRPHRSPFTG